MAAAVGNKFVPLTTLICLQPSQDFEANDFGGQNCQILCTRNCKGQLDRKQPSERMQT